MAGEEKTRGRWCDTGGSSPEAEAHVSHADRGCQTHCSMRFLGISDDGKVGFWPEVVCRYLELLVPVWIIENRGGGLVNRE